MIVCYRCNGQEKVRDRNNKDNIIKCPVCKGKGVVSIDKALSYYDYIDRKNKEVEKCQEYLKRN